jgi:hypothetical protein
MMKRGSLILLLSALLITSATISCKQVASDTKPGSHARISELLVVMDQSLWDGALGDTVRNYFGQYYPWLNQPEAWYSIIHRPPGEFNETYSIYRNILYFVLEPELSGGTIQKETDPWARPQTVVQINGPDFESLFGIFAKNQDAILRAFDQSEIRRLKKVMNSISKQGNAEQIATSLNLKIAVPEGYYLATQEENFVWARKVIKSQTQESAFWITTIPYADTAQFKPSHIIALRDSICKVHIPVQNTSSYMGTETRFGYESKVIDLNGAYAVETRGYWRTFGKHSMGGPFLNYMVHDEKNGRLILIDTYVFKPNEPKRDLIRQLEGIAHTLAI